jgi:SAM-dependent methyltransferase
VVGGDITEATLKLARNHYGARVDCVLMDAHHLPVMTGSVDVIVCLASIIYMRAATLFDESRRALRECGLLLLNTPNKDRPGFRPSSLSCEYHSVPELFSLLEQRGFDTKLFGAFDVSGVAPERRGSPVSRSVAATRGKVGQALRRVGAYDVVARWLAPVRSGIVLGPELEEKQMRLVRDIELTPLSPNTRDVRHRIVYAVAQKR